MRDYVCDPTVIATTPRLVSVTQAFSIDLTGQVCSESLDGRLYGGIATGPAFHRGALASEGGLAVVCLASRTPAGESSIRPELAPGDAVAIGRSDVRWVITEYGTAYLFGRSLAERAVALIEIAHPDFRAGLQSLTDQAAEYLCSVNYEDEMAFAAVIGPLEYERIVGMSCYYLNPATGLPEAAYMIDPDWQGVGLGSILHRRMVEYASHHGVRGFTADVLVENPSMLRVFQRGDHELAITTSGGVHDVTMIFRPSAEEPSS